MASIAPTTIFLVDDQSVSPFHIEKSLRVLYSRRHLGRVHRLFHRSWAVEP